MGTGGQIVARTGRFALPIQQSAELLGVHQCADADVPAFHEVCGALRDVAKNPEWKFVRDAPTWHGRRVATRAELLA